MPQLVEREVKMHIQDSFDASGALLFKGRGANAEGVIGSDMAANSRIYGVPWRGAAPDAPTDSVKWLVRSVSRQVSAIRV